MGISVESQKFVDKVDALKAQGMSAVEACQKLGEKQHRYYSLVCAAKRTAPYIKNKKISALKSRKKYTRRPEVIDLPQITLPETGTLKLFIFTGSPQELLTIAKGI